MQWILTLNFYSVLHYSHPNYVFVCLFACLRPCTIHIYGYILPKIEGPLVGTDESGKSRKCDIQFYMAIEGMCGWHSNYNTDVPWVKGVSTTELYTTEQALTAIRMSGILACTFNAIGTDMALPFGGYGVLGVCNDTAALVDFAVRGETNMYPLLSTGRYLLVRNNKY